MNRCHQKMSKVRTVMYATLTNEKICHMILVIIIDSRAKIMLQRTLGSGWAILLPGFIAVAMAFADLSANAWRAIIIMGLLLTPVMLYHRTLRHFVLLPSGIAVSGGIILAMLNVKLMM